MTVEKLAKVFGGLSDDVERHGSAFRFTISGVVVVCVADVAHDRMRIVAPIAPLSQLEADHVMASMVANFHTALDGRYALSEGTLFALFVHPLSSLTTEQAKSGVEQTVNLVNTFGDTYAASDLTFGETAPRSLPSRTPSELPLPADTEIGDSTVDM